MEPTSVGVMNTIAQTLDAAILKPDMTPAEVLAAMDLCIPFGPKTFCVRPCDVPLVTPICRKHGIGVCVVLGFPHGDQLPESKADEARRYVAAGVDEIDMVCNIGLVRAEAWDAVRADISGVRAVTHPAGVPLKVIFETVFLNAEQVCRLTEICIEAGADFVKTSTGFNGGGAEEDTVRLMLETAAGRAQVKPSGGIRDRARAERFLEMGATRLGVGFSAVPVICAGEGSAATAY